eukprot:5039294-Pleurochrysis_carterae.AAC.1
MPSPSPPAHPRCCAPRWRLPPRLLRPRHHACRGVAVVAVVVHDVPLVATWVSPEAGASVRHRE